MQGAKGFVKKIRRTMRNDEGITGDAQCVEQIVWMLFLKVYDLRESEWENSDSSFSSVIPEDLRWRNWAPSNVGLDGGYLIEFIEDEVLPDVVSQCEKGSNVFRQRILFDAMEETRNYMKDGNLMREVIDDIENLGLSSRDDNVLDEIYESLLSILRAQSRSGEFFTPRPLVDFIVEVVDPHPGESVADLACGIGGFLLSTMKHMHAKDPGCDVSQFLYGVDKMRLPFMICVMNFLLQGTDVPGIRRGNTLEEYPEVRDYDVVLLNPPFGGTERENVKNLFPEEFRSSDTADLFVATVMKCLRKNGRAAIIMPDGFLFGSGCKVAIRKALLSGFNLHTIVNLPASTFHPYTSVETSVLFFDNSGPTSGTWFYRMDMPEGLVNFTYSNPLQKDHFKPILDWYREKKEIRDKGGYKARYFTIDEIKDGGYDLDLCRNSCGSFEYRPPQELLLELREECERIEEERREILEELSAILGDSNGGFH